MIANVEQSDAWNGDDGAHWVKFEEQYEASSRPHWERVMATGLFGSDSRVLDVGCGAGGSTTALARTASRGSALGLDLSAVLLDRARRRAAEARLGNVQFVQGDAQVHPFALEGHDAAASLFGAMFFADPVAAFQNIGKGLVEGSPLVLVGWREVQRNEWISNFRRALAVGRDLPMPPPDAPTPFSFADANHVREVLTAAGFNDVTFDSIDVPMDFGRTADHAWEFVSSLGLVRGLTSGLSLVDRRRALDALHADVVAHDGPAGVTYDSSAWLITARRA